MTKQKSKPSSSTAHGRRKRLVSAASVLPLAIGLASTQLPSGHAPSEGAAVTMGSAFKPTCMPFQGKINHAIDDRCGMQGGSSDKAKQQESQAKNNLCAAKEALPENFTYQELV